uniref:Ata14 protein n=1 Tax=Saccharothrix mutabilis subsp. capreolus TaxID=66854 RepID=Q83W24_STRMP|nr:Ata14 protein [Saccharothrix mutabilis subsp. capreolus]
MMDLVWLGDDARAGSPAAPGWLLAAGLARRGHRVFWVQRDHRDAPRPVEGVRMCPFPYDEREWPVGEGLYWGLVRLLGRETPADAVIAAGGPDLPLAAGAALADRGMRSPVLWWPAGGVAPGWARDLVERSPVPVTVLDGACGTSPTGPPVPVPVPARRTATRSRGDGPLRLTLGALGTPADAVGRALPAVAALARREPGGVVLRFLTMPGRDRLWEAVAATAGLPCARETVTLWGPGFDGDGLWRALEETDRYVSLGSGLDLGAAAAALAGVPVLTPRPGPPGGATCALGTGFGDPDELIGLLAADPQGTDIGHLREVHTGEALLEAWEKVLS